MSIIHVKLPEGDPVRILPFYLAMEEWLARNVNEKEMFFMWQVEPTVIFGRNQQIDKEVNIDYCRRNGINFYRRKSGGGCVYADMDNIMFSYITTSTHVETTFSHYSSLVASMLRSLGLPAEASGRNDVLIDGRKVSGNAFYHIPGRSIVHGTMLFSTNMENMLNAITPSKSKLESKKVQSVASHITTISEHLPDMDIESFKRHTVDFITDGEITLTPENVLEIEEMTRPYCTLRWIEGRIAGKSSVVRNRRIEGVGEFSVAIDLEPGTDVIADVNLQGDFFLTGDADSMLLDRLKGVRLDADSIRNAIDIDPGEVIVGMTADNFVSLFVERD